MDIPLGSDSATVKAAILAKGGIKNDKLSVKDQLVFTNFSMSQREVSSLYVFLVDNKVYNVGFFFQYTDDLIIDSYNSFVTDVTAVYGKPEERDDFNDLSNTNKIRKLRLGNIVIQTIWQSKNKNMITVSIMPLGQSLVIMLKYEDKALFDLNAAKRRSDL